MHSFYALSYVLLLCALSLFICLFYELFSCAILICSFQKPGDLRMHKKYYCTKTNMADNKMDDVLKKLDLSDYRAGFVEEKYQLTLFVIYL